MKIKRLLGIALAAMMLTASLAACSSDNSSSSSQAPSTGNNESSTAVDNTNGGGGDMDLQPAELTLWAHWTSEQRLPTIEKMVEMFNEEYAEYGITATYLGVPWDDYEQKLNAGIVAGEAPSVAITGIEKINVHAMRLQAEDITDYLSDGTQELFYEPMWDAVQYEGRTYALPFNSSTRFIYYNKAMFEAAGLNADDIQTWEDLENAAIALDEALADNADFPNYKLAFHPSYGNFGFDPFSLSNGGSTWDDPLNPDQPILESPENIEVLEWYKNFWNARYDRNTLLNFMGNDGQGTEDIFISQQIAMKGHENNYIATLEMYLEDFEYGTFPVPTGPSYSGGNRTLGGGFAAIVPYGTENVREATLLAEWITCGPAANVWALEQKDVMCAIAPNEQPELNESIGWDTTQESLAYTLITRRHIYAPDASSYKDAHINRIAKDLDDNADPAQVLRDADEEIKEQIEIDRAAYEG